MIFHDEQIAALDSKTATGLQELIEVHLCGRDLASPLSESDRRLLEDFVAKALTSGVTYEQFNELLLVLNQDQTSRTFFDYFFVDEPEEGRQLTLEQLRNGVIRFKGFAIMCFGNFRFAYRRLSRIQSDDEILSELGGFCELCGAIEKRHAERPSNVLDISEIERDQTWYVGEITGRDVSDELRRFEKYRKAHPEIEEDADAVAFAKRLLEMDAEFSAAQEVALRNTDIYLTWSFLDVYVATSMRNKWEYEEIFDFSKELFASPVLMPLNLRFFDPTQSKCTTPRDKGLLEGLMLKRASCTIYMAQETDTLGKDSELAATLAQGKPVIAYVPRISREKFASIVAERPLRYLKLRVLDLQGKGILEQIDGLAELGQRFLGDLATHRETQPFELWEDRDDGEFKQKKDYWVDLCQRFAEAESLAFDNRADVLKKYHPLAMQLDISTGVANGVLVVRTLADCADLLGAMLRNVAEFDIRRDEGCQTLVERISDSVFRVVTDNHKLTNSFWNLYHPRA